MPLRNGVGSARSITWTLSNVPSSSPDRQSTRCNRLLVAAKVRSPVGRTPTGYGSARYPSGNAPRAGLVYGSAGRSSAGSISIHEAVHLLIDQCLLIVVGRAAETSSLRWQVPPTSCALPPQASILAVVVVGMVDHAAAPVPAGHEC
jgi:hypothetical protein